MPLPFVFPYAIVFWAIFLWAYLPEFRIARRSQEQVRRPESRDAGSLQVILLAQGLSSLAAFPLAWIPALRFPKAFDVVAFVTGLLVLVGGSLLRRHCWHMLGEHFTGNVVARASQPVIDKGAYAYVRHPSYTAGILLNVGIGLALGSWASTALLGVSTLAGYLYRIHVEERVLMETIGEPYRRYMATHKRLIPFVY